MAGVSVPDSIGERFDSVYRTTLPDIYGYLLALTGGNRSLSEDLTAETYVNAAKHFARGSGQEVAVPWLKTVAKRRLIDHLRRQRSVANRAERLRTELVVAEAWTTTEDPASAGDPNAEDVYEALNALSADHRMVLVLKYVDDMSVKDISTLIDRSPKGTEALLSRARETFRAVYAGGSGSE